MRSDTAIGIARELIARPTVSRDSNLEFIDDVAAYLKSHGVDVVIQRDAAGRKGNLFATIGPANKPGVVLSGHTDVVPVDDQLWTTPPFDPVVKDGRIYGRGSSDMKGFIAAALSEVPALLRRRLESPVHLVLTYDEEVGCQGAKELVKAWPADLTVKPHFCLVGEPTRMQVVNAHKGMRLLRTTVRGRSAHSSAPQRGVSAIATMAKLACFLDGMAERAQTTPVESNLRFPCPHTTVNLGIITGGTAINIVPEAAQLLWEYRHLPQEDSEAVLRAFRAYSEELERAADAGRRPQIATEELSVIPALCAEGNAAVTRFLLEFIGAREAQQVDYGTEAGLFQDGLGVPTVICGPGSIAEAHRPDEYLEVEQLDQASGFLNRLLGLCEDGAWGALTGALTGAA
jgi:acetylornithine deacetylase